MSVRTFPIVIGCLLAFFPQQSSGASFWGSCAKMVLTPWFVRGEVVSPAMGWHSLAENSTPKDSQARVVWAQLQRVDPLSAAWLVAHVEGIELLPAQARLRLAHILAQPSFHFLLERTWGRLSVRHREGDMSFWKDILPADGVSALYMHFPFRHLMIMGSRSADWSVAPGLLLRELARRIRSQVGWLNPDYFSALDTMYMARMHELGLSPTEYRVLQARLREYRLTGYTSAEIDTIRNRVERLFADERQAWSAAEYFTEGVRQHFDAPDRLRQRDPDLSSALEKVFGPQAEFFPDIQI